MSTLNDKALLDDLAAHWTDSALEILHAASVSPISIERELDLWKTLRAELRTEIRWQRSLRVSTLVSLSTLREQVLRKATLAAVRKFASHRAPIDMEIRLRTLVREQRPTAAELSVYAKLVRVNALSVAFKPPTRTDYFPRLHVAAGI